MFDFLNKIYNISLYFLSSFYVSRNDSNIFKNGTIIISKKNIEILLHDNKYYR